MCVQYIGGCSVHRLDTMSTSGGYHEYIERIWVHAVKLMLKVIENKFAHVLVQNKTL